MEQPQDQKQSIFNLPNFAIAIAVISILVNLYNSHQMMYTHGYLDAVERQMELNKELRNVRNY